MNTQARSFVPKKFKPVNEEHKQQEPVVVNPQEVPKTVSQPVPPQTDVLGAMFGGLPGLKVMDPNLLTQPKYQNISKKQEE